MEVLTITSENYSEEVEKSDKPVLLDFWADWCAPCRMMSPIVDAVAEELGDKIKVGKVNVEEEQELAMQFQIMNIPTLLIFKGGKVVNQFIGVQDKNTIIEQFI